MENFNLSLERDNHPIIFAAFQKQMIGKEYGYPQTLSAWLWFKAGWLEQDETCKQARKHARKTT
jgi:hypothetical protein